MPGTVYTVPPIPPNPEHTTYVDAGALRFGVEWRLLDDAELAANYEGDAMEEIQANLEEGQAVEDNGVSIHVLATRDGHEYLRFDCFREGPHYHYIEPSGERQTIVDFDPVAHGEMLPWTFRQLRERLAPMLEYSGGEAILPSLDADAISSALETVAKLAHEAEAALAAQGR